MRLMIVCILWIGLMAHESFGTQVALMVDQTHTLAWNWEQMPDGGGVDRFVFRCGQITKEILGPTARSLQFGNLIDEAGVYTGCTLTAKNSAGESVPATVPDFSYAYSYVALSRMSLDVLALVVSLSTLALAGSRALRRLVLDAHRDQRGPSRRVRLAYEDQTIIDVTAKRSEVSHDSNA